MRVGILAGRADLNLVTVLGGDDTVPAFWDAATALAEALAQRGLAVRLGKNELARNGTHYLFGIHALGFSAQRAALPLGSVVINSEPIANPAQVFGAVDFASYLPMLEGMHVWDYSRRNVDAFQRANISARSFSWVPIGHADRNMTPLVEPRPTQDIDVLFYGRINDRRASVLAECRLAGLRVVGVSVGCVGAERDALIARSKIVLNMGWADDSVFEQYRVSYLMNNGKAVVTEMHPDERLPEAYCAALAVARYDQLAETCVKLVKDSAWRARLEVAAPLALKLPIFDECLDAALARIHPPCP